jgi:hypothetical protein
MATDSVDHVVDDVWDTLNDATNHATQPYTYEDVARAVREALADRAIVALPKPNRRQDECGVDAGFWHIGNPGPRSEATDIMSYEIDGQPWVYTGPGPDYAYTVAAMRERCLAGLAACDDAERLAVSGGSGASGVTRNDH